MLYPAELYPRNSREGCTLSCTRQLPDALKRRAPALSSGIRGEDGVADGSRTRHLRSHNPGDLFPLGVTTVTYTATDDFANQTSVSFTITVREAGLTWMN